MQQSRACSISSINCGCAGIFTPKSVPLSLSVAFLAQQAVPRRTGLPAAIQQTHIFHACVEHNFATRAPAYTSRPYRMTVVSWQCRVLPASLLVVHQKLCSTAFAFHFVGIDVVSTGNMADKVSLGAPQAASMTFQSPAGFAEPLYLVAGRAAIADKPAAQSRQFL